MVLKPFRFKIFLLTALYTLIFTTLDLLRHFSYTQNSNDVAAFDQSLWNFLHGRGFYNSIERMSHFGVHNSSIIFALLPIYALWQSPITLIVLQCFACALGIGIIYLIASKIAGNKMAFWFALLFSLYHPLHGVSWDILNELAYVVPALLLLYYGYLDKRPVLMWIGAIAAVMCKEEIGLVVGFFGLFLIMFPRTRELGTVPSGQSPIPGIALVLFGFGWTFLSLDVVIPHFRNGPYQYFSIENRYSEFGSSLGQIAWHAITKPAAVIRTIFTRPKIFYCLELLAPLAFLSLCSPAAMWMAFPTLAANLLSNAPMMSMVGARYPAALIPFVFISAIYGSTHVKISKGLLLTFTLLCTLLLNSTPLRFPFRKIPLITRHDRIVRRILNEIPPGSVVSTQPNFTAHLPHGCSVTPFFQPGSDYVLLDPSFWQWYRDSKMTPREIEKRGYHVINSEDGVLLFQNVTIHG